ncbi:MAG TPA: NBR1-Ig-like domain-containing protein [Anaerolineae bacterium]|nr:NBR1-Ig-like domain-containing protein [Anaerolineae bacterium]
MSTVPFNPQTWRETIWSITSVFESGIPQGNPAAYQNYDAGIVSYGAHQATLQSGTLQAVLEKYWSTSTSATAQALKNEYQTPVANKKPELRHDQRFKSLLINAATEPEMLAAQHDVFATNFYNPAIELAQSRGVETPLGLACVYDTRIQGGSITVTGRVDTALGGHIGQLDHQGRFITEKRWITTFLNVRENWLNELADRNERLGNTINAQHLRTSTFRVRELRTILDNNNLLLTGTFFVRQQRITGITHPEPDTQPDRRTIPTKVRNKIGFHTGPAGNRLGINTADWGGWMKSLDDAGIPFFIKSVDDYGPIHEAVQYIKQSGHDHTAVYRLSTAGQNDNLSYDIPEYNQSPAAAAAIHWTRTLAKLPPEFDKEHVWVEPINEVDRNLSDWLGQFAVHIADLAQNDGYKVTLFGWSSGEPEMTDWETPGMLDYLRLCAARPNQAAIALHEYSYDRNNLQDGYPFKLGRFKLLFDICDKHNILRPTIHITEWGWEYQDIPNATDALAAIKWANQLYGPYPEIKGAGIWYLGGGSQWGNIADQTQKLIRPLTELTLTTEFEVEVEESIFPIINPGDGDGDGDTDTTDGGVIFTPPTPPVTRLPSNAKYRADVNFTDLTKVAEQQRITKRWLVRNNGQSTWDENFNLVYVPDDVNGSRQLGVKSSFPLREVISQSTVAPGDTVEVAVPMDIPAVDMDTQMFSDWRFQDDAGTFFGDLIYIKIIVTANEEEEEVLTSNSQWLENITISRGSVVEPGASFIKTWRVRNNGETSWGRGFSIVAVSNNGFPFTGRLSHPLPEVAPGEDTLVSIPLVAPTEPRDQNYVSMWRMHDDHGIPFGDSFWVEIKIETQYELPYTPYSQNDSRWKNKPLGDGTFTIGEFGCLLTAMSMISTAFQHPYTPASLHDRIAQPGGPRFGSGSITFFNTLNKLHTDIIYEGRYTSDRARADDPNSFANFDPHTLSRVDAALTQGKMVVAQVDRTPVTPYNPSADQHWVLLIARSGDDYLAIDPANGNQIQLRSVYGRAHHTNATTALNEAILSVLIYRSTRHPVILTPHTPPSPTPPALGLLQTGFNINPDAPHSNPYQNDTFKGLNWVRFVFKVDAQVHPDDRHLGAAYEQYSPIIKAYADKDISSLIIINQETTYIEPGWNAEQWDEYTNNLAARAGQIAAKYADYGNKVAYQIWNEGDLDHNPASFFVEPEQFAILLTRVARQIRQVAPNSKLIFGGLASGPPASIPYLKKCLAAMNNTWPVDAIGIHPYGRWATRAPFDWAQRFGTLAEAFALYNEAFPNMPLWITEMGVAVDNTLGREHDEDIANYMSDVYSHLGARFADKVPVVIWFAWSDWMRNAGVVTHTGANKNLVFNAFKSVRDRTLDGL